MSEYDSHSAPVYLPINGWDNTRPNPELRLTQRGLRMPGSSLFARLSSPGVIDKSAETPLELALVDGTIRLVLEKGTLAHWDGFAFEFLGRLVHAALPASKIGPHWCIELNRGAITLELWEQWATPRATPEAQVKAVAKVAWRPGYAEPHLRIVVLDSSWTRKDLDPANKALRLLTARKPDLRGGGRPKNTKKGAQLSAQAFKRWYRDWDPLGNERPRQQDLANHLGVKSRATAIRRLRDVGLIWPPIDPPKRGKGVI